MSDIINHQWTVAEHPIHEVDHRHFGYKESQVPDLQDGQILIKSHYLCLSMKDIRKATLYMAN